MRAAVTTLLLVSAFSVPPRVLAAGADDSSKRMAVAVLPPRNQAADTNSAHWAYFVSVVLSSHLAEVKSLRVLPESSVAFAFRELNLVPDQALDSGDVKRLGESIKARWVVYGGYERLAGAWRLTVRAVQVATDKSYGDLTTSSAGWGQVLSEASEGLLHQLGVSPTEEQRERIRRPLTRSPAALELVSRAFAASRSGKRLLEVEADLRQAVSLDPTFALALQGLADVLALQGKSDEAARTAKRAVEARPDSAASHRALGSVYLSQGLRNLARDEFLEGLRLEPDRPEIYTRLSGVYVREGKWDEAVSVLKTAEGLAPYDAMIHATLGYTYPRLGQRDAALAELALAERYNTGTDAGIDLTSAAGYDLLGEVPQAVQSYEKFVARADGTGLRGLGVDRARQRLGELKERLSPHPVAAVIPKAYSPRELESVLQSRLTPQEYELTVVPFVGTLEMTNWASQLVRGARSPMERAKRLFLEVSKRLAVGDDERLRTAAEAFRDWFDPKAGLTCHDYALLYILYPA